MPTPNRYYYILDNKQMGPNTAEDMSEAIRAGVFTAAPLVCLEGGSQWIQLSRCAELSAYLPEEAKRPRRVKVNAVPPTRPTPPADPLAKPALSAQALGTPKTPATPQTTVAPSLTVAASPAITVILRIIAATNLFLGVIAAVLYFSESYPMSGLIGVCVLVGSLLTSIFLYAFSELLTWVYNIMLNTSK